MLANFRGIFADPRAKVCFTSVFFEAIFVHGLFPFVALLLIAVGQPSAIVAGLLIGCFAFGGVVYSLSVPYLVARIPEPRLMILGGAISAAALALIALQFSWVVQIGLFTMFGFGFYLLHSCIQVHVTDLSQTARGAATSMHSTCFFMGQAIGPVVYGYGFAHGGMEATMFVGSRGAADDRHRLLAAAASPRREHLRRRLSPPAIGRDALVGQPDALRQPAGLPEHVDRHAAARVPVAADPQPFRLQQRRRAACRSPTVQSSWKAPWLRKLAR